MSVARLHTLLAVPLLCTLAACASTRPQTTFEDPATLIAERDEWRGPRGGSVVLRYHVEALVDARPDPSRATSTLVVHLVMARFAGPMPALTLPLPAAAKRIHTAVRLLPTTGPAVELDSLPETRGPSDIDPALSAATLTLPDPPESGVVEAILHYELPGTLAADARWLGFANVPTAELLFRYSLPSHSRGRFTTTLEGARPLQTEKDGRTLMAVLAQDLPPLGEARPLARYVTVKVAPLGYEAELAGSWRQAAANYYAGLVDRSPKLTDGYEVPHRPKDAADALTWVHARPGISDEVAWNTPKSLPNAIAKNTLSAVDKVHLLAWLLREAKLPFVFAMGRPAAYPALAADLPTPGAFSVPLVFLPTLGTVVDPGCPNCAPGQVRDALVGGQALLLTPAGLEPTLISLPGQPGSAGPSASSPTVRP